MSQTPNITKQEIENALGSIPTSIDHNEYRQVVTNLLGALDGDVSAAEDALQNWNEESRKGQYAHDLGQVEEAGNAAGLIEIAHSHGHHLGDSDGENDRSHNDVDRLLQLAQGMELFKTSSGDPYASYKYDGRRETARIGGNRFEEYLRILFYRSEGRAISDSALQSAISTLGATAKYDGEEQEVHLRVAKHGGNIFIDIGNEAREVVRVTPNGWSVVEDYPVRFRRPANMKPLSVPSRRGDLSLLRKHVPVKDDESFALLLGWMVQALHTEGAYPPLVITGPQGAGKSTTTRIISRLIAPSVPELRDLPSNKRDLAITAERSWLLTFDNQESPPSAISDALCRLSTGGGFSVRKLYTDLEEQVFEQMRPVILNGITNLLERADLMDRSVILSLRSISMDKRKTEQQIWSDFEKDEPNIFGGLLDALVEALGAIDDVHLDKKPRMADFAAWAVAAEGAFPIPKGTFIEAYRENRKCSHRDVLEREQAARVVYDAVKQNGEWKGNATNLLSLIQTELGDDPSAAAPENVQQMTALRDRTIRPILEQFGIEYEEVKKRNRTFRFYDTEKKSESPSEERVQRSQNDSDSSVDVPPLNDRNPKPGNRSLDNASKEKQDEEIS
jgi:energy-coupling factor transporter ATP-binding protein EcfA2